MNTGKHGFETEEGSGLRGWGREVPPGGGGVAFGGWGGEVPLGLSRRNEKMGKLKWEIRRR